MGLISLIEHLAQVLTGGTASKVAADEVKAWSPWLAARLTKFAVRRLPEADRERYAEEWDSHVADTPGSVGKICVACGFLFAANRMRRANALPLKFQIERVIWLILMDFNFKVVITLLDRFVGRYDDGLSTPPYLKALVRLSSRGHHFMLRWAYRLLKEVVRLHN